MFNRSSHWFGLFVLIFLAGCITTEIDDRPPAPAVMAWMTH